MFQCASEGDGINQSSVRALSEVAKQGVICIVVEECTYYNCSVGLLPFSCRDVCVCACVSCSFLCFCVPDFDSTCFRLVPNVDSGK
jgi:hypothetical protein